MFFIRWFSGLLAKLGGSENLRLTQNGSSINIEQQVSWINENVVVHTNLGLNLHFSPGYEDRKADTALKMSAQQNVVFKI